MFCPSIRLFARRIDCMHTLLCKLRTVTGRFMTRAPLHDSYIWVWAMASFGFDPNIVCSPKTFRALYYGMPGVMTMMGSVWGVSGETVGINAFICRNHACQLSARNSSHNSRPLLPELLVYVPLFNSAFWPPPLADRALDLVDQRPRLMLVSDPFTHSPLGVVLIDRRPPEVWSLSVHYQTGCWGKNSPDSSPQAASEVVFSLFNSFVICGVRLAGGRLVLYDKLLAAHRRDIVVVI